jgi:RNA polymerase sigma-70 factor (ECF subfamily)
MADPPLGEPSDAALLEQHVNGDPEAFGLLFKRHSGRLWAVALRITSNSDDAADALQDAMVSAFRRAGDFRGDSAVTTWLHRIVVNSALDLLRRRAHQHVDWSGNPDELPVPEPRQGTDGMASTDSRLDIDSALAKLPPPVRAALVLVDMLGYSVADAAAIFEVPEGTVKSRCARGRAKLLPLLAHLRIGFAEAGNQADAGDVSVQQGGGV